MICRSCKENKPEEEFNWRWKALGIRQPVCRECERGVRRIHYGRHADEIKTKTRSDKVERQRRAREFVFDYLSYHVCEVCGEYRPEMLQFDHVRGKKTKSISELVQDGASIETIKAEILKCRVICANCHQLAEKRKRER